MTKPDFHAIGVEIESAMRSIGVYVDADDMTWMDPRGGAHDEDDEVMDSSPEQDDRTKGAKKSSYVMMVNGLIGDVAFSSRVQDPGQYDMDAEFRMMANDLRREKYEDNKEDIRKALEGL